MNFIETDIAGVFVVEPTVFEDSRGYFFESYNEAEFIRNSISARFIQDNQSKSHYGVIRGLHCQTGEYAQAKLVHVLQGSVLDVAVDIRSGSPTFGKHVAVELSGENKRQLYIPRGFLHGFSVQSKEAVFAYKCDNFYCREAESGVRFDDASLGIDWRIPSKSAVISDKDKLLGEFKDVLSYGR